LKIESVSFGCACHDFDPLRLEFGVAQGSIIFGFRMFSRKMAARQLPEWRNGKSTLDHFRPSRLITCRSRKTIDYTLILDSPIEVVPSN
jgi:hypothetical protein